MSDSQTHASFEPVLLHGHRVFGVTGWKNSGKTTLITRLIGVLTERGYRISSVKHAHHACDIDKPGTDSYRHREAGSGEVALIAAGKRWALMHECAEEQEPLLGDVLSRMGPCDLVLIEGYKTEPFPKIEVRRADAKDKAPLHVKDHMIIALASDQPQLVAPEETLPRFQLDDVERLAEFVIKSTGLRLL